MTEYLRAIEIKLSPERTTCTTSTGVGDGDGVGVLVGDGLGVGVGVAVGVGLAVGVGVGDAVADGIRKTCPTTIRSEVTVGFALLSAESVTRNLAAMPERVSPDLTV